MLDVKVPKKVLDNTDWELTSFCAPNAYELARVVDVSDGQDVVASMVLPVMRGEEMVYLQLPKAAARYLKNVNGRRSLLQPAIATRTDPIAFNSIWSKVDETFCDSGFMFCSKFLKD